MSSKFDEYERERLEREATIVELESKVVSLSTKVEKLEYIADRMEQYSRCNSILIHGLPEEKREDTDSLGIETVKEKMGLDISSADTDRTHRIGAPPIELVFLHDTVYKNSKNKNVLINNIKNL